MERYRYIAKRLLTAIPTFLGITILVYVVASWRPARRWKSCLTTLMPLRGDGKEE